jgi:SAM-dependent methyltransferase
MTCKICQGATQVVGEKQSSLAKRTFRLRRCDNCHFAFVEDPWLDYAAIYDAAYYEGRGADPTVDYHYELAHPARALRRYEWSGIIDVVGRLTELRAETRWLDFGCGNGGLVRHARAVAGCQAIGNEEGAIAADARKAGIPIVDRAELKTLEGTFDVVTAIEVLEHVVEPLEVLGQIRRMLRPGGIFFYTTGNALPQRHKLLGWSYFRPEIHISLYEPASMDQALRRSGFEPRQMGYIPGWDQITAFKVLKNLGRRRANALYKAIPWRALTPLINRRFGMYDFPVGFAA